MTATITPPAGVPGLARSDPSLRIEDYRSALEFNLGLLGRGIDRIVFADNSDSDVGVLRELVRRAGLEDQVEFLVFAGLDYPPSRGRCYGEMRLLDYVMSHSSSVSGAARACIFWKTTGRYKVLNLLSVIRRRPCPFDLYCDMRDSGTPWCDMRLIAWTKSGYESILRGIYAELDSGPEGKIPGEFLMHKALTSRAGLGLISTSYTVEPLVSGVRAYDNKNWALGRQRLVYYARAAQRRLFGRPVW